MHHKHHGVTGKTDFIVELCFILVCRNELLPWKMNTSTVALSQWFYEYLWMRMGKRSCGIYSLINENIKVCPLQSIFVRTRWHQPNCLLVAKGTPVCAPLWRHRCYCCSIVITLRTINGNLCKLFININEWIAYVQYKHFIHPPTPSPTKLWIAQGRAWN